MIQENDLPQNLNEFLDTEKKIHKPIALNSQEIKHIEYKTQKKNKNQ